MSLDTAKIIFQGALGAMTFGAYSQYTNNKLMELNNKNKTTNNDIKINSIEIKHDHAMNELKLSHNNDINEMKLIHNHKMKALEEKLEKKHRMEMDELERKFENKLVEIRFCRWF